MGVAMDYYDNCALFKIIDWWHLVPEDVEKIKRWLESYIYPGFNEYVRVRLPSGEYRPGPRSESMELRYEFRDTDYEKPVSVLKIYGGPEWVSMYIRTGWNPLKRKMRRKEIWITSKGDARKFVRRFEEVFKLFLDLKELILTMRDERGERLPIGNRWATLWAPFFPDLATLASDVILRRFADEFARRKFPFYISVRFLDPRNYRKWLRPRLMPFLDWTFFSVNVPDNCLEIKQKAEEEMYRKYGHREPYVVPPRKVKRMSTEKLRELYLRHFEWRLEETLIMIKLAERKAIREKIR